MKKQKITKQVFLVIIGKLILGVGVGFILYANIGYDAFGVFHAGIANTFNITFGAAFFFESLIALVAIFFIDRSYINFATVISLFLVGFMADYANLFLTYIYSGTLTLFVSLLLVFIGSVILGVGLNLYVLADLGVGALDAIAEIISDKSKFEYGVVKMANDIFFLAIGYFLGGQVGVATIITAIIIGPIIQFIRKRISKTIDIWINKPILN